KAGMSSVPLFTLCGEEALEFRLQNCGARAIVTDREQLPKIAKLRDRLPDLETVLCVDGPAEGALDLHTLAAKASDRFQIVDTSAEDPALIIYTSGTTGQPKGALHAHRTLLGHLPGVEYPQDGFPKPDDRFWTPADWAWIGGLYDVLFPSWHYGVTVVAHRMRRFDAAHVFDLMARHRVRNAFLVPTTLKMMRQVEAPRQQYDIRLRTIFTGGEAVGEEVIRWAREELGVTPHEGYGQTEVNLVLGNCSMLMPVRPGSMGRPIPGHVVDVVDEAGQPVPVGERGEVV